MSVQEKSIYSQNPMKQANVLAGVSGSFIHEISSGDISDYKSWLKEWNDSDFTKGYDLCFESKWEDKLNSSKTLEDVQSVLIEMNLEANFKIHQNYLKNLGVTVESTYNADGRVLSIQTDKGLLTLDCASPSALQFENWLDSHNL